MEIDKLAVQQIIINRLSEQEYMHNQHELTWRELTIIEAILDAINEVLCDHKEGDG